MYKDHLHIKTTFLWSQGRSLYTSLTVLSFGLTILCLFAPDIRSQLTEQIRCLDNRLDTNVAILFEIQEFYKKRAEVEREYSKSLDKLVKNIMMRHNAEKQKYVETSAVLEINFHVINLYVSDPISTGAVNVFKDIIYMYVCIGKWGIPKVNICQFSVTYIPYYMCIRLIYWVFSTHKID